MLLPAIILNKQIDSQYYSIFTVSFKIKPQNISLTADLRKVILSFCREHLTSSIASARDMQSIPLIITTSSPTAMD